MAGKTLKPDIQRGRLDPERLAANFADLHPPLSRSEALVAADRCYFCFDAPCTAACPTGIDIPAFIQKIRSNNILGSARTILSENIMGGMCARVCPTEVLCEEACVRNTHEEKPVDIGLLQRYATDPVIESGEQLFTRAPRSGRKAAIVGGGPAGLSCAHRLAMHGHDVVVFNRDARPGGLNEYGIAAYKTVDDFAQKEIAWILAIGGIEVRNNCALGKDFDLDNLRREFDAVFLGIGLGRTNPLAIEGDERQGVVDAVDYVADIRQAQDLGDLPVGRRVVVVGGGMTAIDIAVQSKALGAERVDIVYRRGPDEIGASEFEQALAQTSGVGIRFWARPTRIVGDPCAVGIEFERTTTDAAGEVTGTGEHFVLDADVVFRAIGQRFDSPSGPELRDGRIVVDDDMKTSLPGVWAGGDCVLAGDDITVSAVQHGKIAAIDMDRYLRGQEHG